VEVSEVKTWSQTSLPSRALGQIAMFNLTRVLEAEAALHEN